MTGAGDTIPPPCGEGQAREAGQGGEGSASPARQRFTRDLTDQRGQHHKAIERARAARKTLTPHEARMWGFLKHLRARGFHFRRQVPFRGYQLDFVCYSRRLVIELDGGGHQDDAQAHKDRVRDGVLKREGFRVLRIWNGEVNADFDGVTEAVLRALAEPSPPWPAEPVLGPASGRTRGPACPSPQGGGRSSDHV